MKVKFKQINKMKKIVFQNIFVNSLVVFLALVVYSCSSNNLGDDDMDTSQNDKLVGTRWDLKNWDYSLGDEYIGIHDETYTIYFYSKTNGIIYFGRKDSYSDQGTTTSRAVSHFEYSVNGNNVKLKYITDIILPIYTFVINSDILASGELEFYKSNISTSDKAWIKTIQGVTGSCEWYSDIKSTLWVVGNGEMSDYSSYSETPWAKSNRTPNKVVVEDGVTAIGANAFANVSIVEVEMPDKSLKKVGEASFKGSLIQTIWMSDNTTIIGVEAFANCVKLKDINIPENIVSIGEYAFSGCTALNEFRLEFGENVRTIGAFAFEGGDASYLSFADGVQSISTGAFIGNYCGISKELLLPNSLTTIGATVFEGSYKKIIIGTGIKEIGDKAFISGAASGEMYVNLSTPPSAGNNIIVERSNWSSAESRWTLYVPKGCKAAYSNKSPWNKFKSIVEDETLIGEGENNSETGNEDDSEYSDKEQDEADANSSKRGYVTNGFSGGSGSYSDPYIISTAAELRYFSDAVRQGNIFKNQYVKLNADIVINRNVLTSDGELNGDGSEFESWIPIGRYEPSFFFCGTFDGNGHSISGLYCNRPQGENVGFFGKLYGTVKNLTIKDSYFKGHARVGGIAGTTIYSYNSTTIPSSILEYYQTDKDFSVISCKNEATIIGEINSGGIIGYNTNASKVSKCLNTGYIKGTQNLAGIVGFSSTTDNSFIISDCANLGTIVAVVDAGGILCDGRGTSIINSLNCGSIEASDTSPIGVGGICGEAGKSQSCKIQNCVNYSLHIEGLDRLGAIIGWNNGLTVSKNIYLYKSGLSAIGGSSGGSSSSNISKTESEMKSQETLNLLNSRAGSSYSKWKFGEDGFPVLEWME